MVLVMVGYSDDDAEIMGEAEEFLERVEVWGG